MATAGRRFPLMMPLLLLLLLMGCCCSCSLAVQPVEVKQPGHEAGYFISGIVENLLKPLKRLLAAQVNSIIQSIVDQGGHIADQLKAKINAFVELIRPFVIRIIDRINDIVGQGVDLKERIQMAIESLFNFLGVINDTNKEILQILINYIKELLFSKMSLENSLMRAGNQLLLRDHEAEFLIGGIVEWLLRPLKTLLLNQVNSIIQSIVDQGGHIADQLKAKINAFVELIRPFVIRIIDRINDIVGAGVELKERIQMAVESIFEYLGLLTQANKEIVRLLINYIVDKLLGTMPDTQLAAVALTTPRLVDGLIDWLIKPIVQLIRRQVNALIRSLLDQADHAAGKLLEHVDKIAELIRPSVIRILDLSGNLHGEIDNLWQHVNEAVIKILANIGSIAGESAEIVTLLINRVTDIIVQTLNGQPIFAEQYLIIDRIISRILQPLLRSINDLLDRIRQAAEEATEDAKQRMLQLINELSLLLKAPIVRIIGVLGDLGVEIGDTVGAIRRALELIINSVSGIHEENKQMFKAIIGSVLESLLELVQNDLAVRLNYSILIDIMNRILAPFVGKINELLDSLREELAETIENIAEVIGGYVDRLARLLSPLVSQIVLIMKQLGLGGRDIVENVRQTLQMLIEHVSGIADANKQLLNRLIGDLISRIVELVKE